LNDHLPGPHRRRPAAPDPAGVVRRIRRSGLAAAVVALDLLPRALGPCDDAAMNALWSRFDGAGAASDVGAAGGERAERC
jgi:hypothetical protein